MNYLELSYLFALYSFIIIGIVLAVICIKNYIKEYSPKTSSTHRKDDDQYFDKLDKACSHLTKETSE